MAWSSSFSSRFQLRESQCSELKIELHALIFPPRKFCDMFFPRLPVINGDVVFKRCSLLKETGYAFSQITIPPNQNRPFIDTDPVLHLSRAGSAIGHGDYRRAMSADHDHPAHSARRRGRRSVFAKSLGDWRQ